MTQDIEKLQQRRDQLRRERDVLSNQARQGSQSAAMQLEAVASAARAAECAYDSALEAKERPKRVVIHSPRAELERQRASLLQTRAVRERDLEQAIAAVRQQCPPNWSEQSCTTYVRQQLNLDSHTLKKTEQRERELLAALDEQLAELDRRASTQPAA